MLDFPPDLTFVAQLVGFFALLWILNRLLFAPFLAVLNERAERTEGAAADAAVEQVEAGELKAKIDAAMAEARREAAVVAETIRRDGRAKESAIYEQAKEKAAAKLSDLRSGIAGERSSAEAELRNSAKTLAQSMVEHILGSSRT